MGHSQSFNHESFSLRFKTVRRDPIHNIIYCLDKEQLTQYAAKTIIMSTAEQQQLYEKVIIPRMKLRHENIINIKQCYQIQSQSLLTQRKQFLLLFAYPFKSLREQVDQRLLIRDTFSQPEIWSVLYSCVKALKYLSNNHYQYDALTLSNILIGQDGEIILNEPMFFDSEYVEHLIRTFNKLGQYLPPELRFNAINQFQGLQIEKANIYALGVILLELVHMSRFNNLGAFRINDVEKALKRYTDDIVKNYSEQLKQIIKKMVTVDPQERLTYQQILQFIQNEEQSRFKKMMARSQLQTNATYIATPIKLSHTLNSRINTQNLYTNTVPSPQKEMRTSAGQQKVSKFAPDRKYSAYNKSGINQSFPKLSNFTISYDFTDLSNIEQYEVCFEGNFKDTVRHGPGKIYLKNGEKFMGNFIDGKIQGRGQYTTKDLQTIKGVWKDGILIYKYNQK